VVRYFGIKAQQVDGGNDDDVRVKRMFAVRSNLRDLALVISSLISRPRVLSSFFVNRDSFRSSGILLPIMWSTKREVQEGDLVVVWLVRSRSLSL
jgi:hypothetical protein